MNVFLNNALNRFNCINFKGAKTRTKDNEEKSKKTLPNFSIIQDCVSFGSNKKENNVHILGYDGADVYNNCTFDFIRNSIYEHCHIYDDELHNGRMLRRGIDFIEAQGGSTKKSKINDKIIQQTEISNLFKTEFCGYRGKMLAKAKGAVFEKLKESGVNTVIDLRLEANNNLKKYCEARDLEYMNFPIVLADSQSDDVLIENLPKFIKAINDGDFFMGCSTGCQRTDVALAMAYCFNPESKDIPIMLGYRKKDAVNFSKINETLNRIFNKLSPEQKESIGGVELYKKKRNALVSHNNNYCKWVKPTPSEEKEAKTFDMKALNALNVPNFAMVSESGVRGESLSAKRNRHFLKDIAGAGVKNVIDLRTTDHTELFEKLCKDGGLRCIHIPIDCKTTPTEEIIKNLPQLFEIINKGKFYISCAQGLHRTDIALSINYLFNPKARRPPELIGHMKDGHLRCSDIFTRANDIYNNLTSEDKALLGWDEKFDKNYKLRKVNLVKAQKTKK